MPSLLFLLCYIIVIECQSPEPTLRYNNEMTYRTDENNGNIARVIFNDEKIKTRYYKISNSAQNDGVSITM